MRLRRLAVVGTSAVASLALLQTPAHALYWDDCVYYTGTTTSLDICVTVDGSQRAGYIEGFTSSSSIFLDISSLYLRQCDGYGSNCVIVRQESGVAGGGPSAEYFGQSWTVSFGHTYKACASLTINNDRYTNVCSTFRTN